MYDVGPQLRILRKERGETLEQVAEATGLSIAMLSRVERGERLPSPESAEALAAYFGLPPEELLGETIANQMIGRYGGSRASAAADRVRQALGEDTEPGENPRAYGGLFRSTPIENLGLVSEGHQRRQALEPLQSVEHRMLRSESAPRAHRSSQPGWRDQPQPPSREATEALETAERVFDRTVRDLDRLRPALSQKERYQLAMRLRQTAAMLRELADDTERD